MFFYTLKLKFTNICIVTEQQLCVNMKVNIKETRGFLLVSLDRASFLNKLEETMGVVWKKPHGDLSNTLCGRAKASIHRLASALPLLALLRPKALPCPVCSGAASNGKAWDLLVVDCSRLPAFGASETSSS